MDKLKTNQRHHRVWDLGGIRRWAKARIKYNHMPLVTWTSTTVWICAIAETSLNFCWIQTQPWTSLEIAGTVVGQRARCHNSVLTPATWQQTQLSTIPTPISWVIQRWTTVEWPGTSIGCRTLPPRETLIRKFLIVTRTTLPGTESIHSQKD